MGYAKYAKRIFHKTKVDPHYLILFITDVCNAHCGHCLLGWVNPSSNELTVDEYEKISKSMGDLLFLLPTGGEPFLRDDISEIVHIFCKNNNVRNVGIPTNGSLTTKVISQVRTMLDQNPGVDFAIDVSIDAIGKDHDRLRAIPGLFEKCIWTFQELQKLEKEYPSFNANIATTMSGFNQENVMKTYRTLRDQHGVKNVNNLIARKGARAAHALDVDREKYLEWVAELRRDTENNSDMGYTNYPGADVINAMKNVRQDVISETVRTGQYQLPCYAANMAGIIYAGGDVYPCEILEESLGNLRDVDYDFREIWFSDRTEEVRKMIRDTKCFCTFENYLTNSVLFTPEMLPKMAYEWMKLKVRRQANHLFGKKNGNGNGVGGNGHGGEHELPMVAGGGATGANGGGVAASSDAKVHQPVNTDDIDAWVAEGKK